LNRTVDRGKTLLVDGPAAVTFLSGKVEVFGFSLSQPRKIIIREGKRLPFHALEKTQLNLSLGAAASASEVEGDTIPSSWAAAYETVNTLEQKPTVVMVVGCVDSGKSSFCTYLTNRLVSDGRRVAILDEDLGQSDVGPPATVAYALVSKPVTDLFNLKPEGTVFVGSTSPMGVADKTIAAVASLKAEIAGKTVDALVVNTDGWVTGDEALKFKRRLALAVQPEVAFCLEIPAAPASPCADLAKSLEGFSQECVTAPVAVRERDKERRRSLRELGFSKYLEGARTKVFPLSYLSVEGGKEASQFIARGGAEDLLVALYDAQKKFLGIGVLRAFDYDRKALKIQTAVTEKPASVVLGRTRLDEYFRELS
jgi:polynucleotide 5'-hydroxyl-kinase GRC3/NOL9